MSNNVFIAGPADVFLYDKEQLVSVCTTMLNSSITIDTSAEDVRGGFGNMLFGKYFHTSNFNMELEDSMFRMEWVRYAIGATGSLGADIATSESVTLGAGGTGKINGTAAPVGGATVAWIDTGTGWAEVAVGADGTFTYADGEAGKTYCVNYMTNNGDASVITVSSSIIPSELHAIAKCQLFAGGKNNSLSASSKVGYVYIDIPRLLLSGGATISLNATGASTTPLSGQALAYEGDGGCNEGSYYAKIIQVENGVKWYDSISDIAIDDAELDVVVAAKTEAISVLGYGPNVNGYKVNASDLTFTSGDVSIATVDATGVVTGVAAGKTTIEVKVTAKPSLSAFAVVTVTTAS